MSIWSHRPPFLHLGLFVAAYVLGCAFAEALAIVPGSTVSFWPPGGLFIATLILTPVGSWPWWVLGGCLAEMFGQLVWFQSPLPAGLLIFGGNALEAMVGAWLVTRVCGRPVRLETVPEVLTFVVLGAGIAPAISATVGSAALAWFGVKSQTFAAAWPLWWIGDATGILIVAPLTLVVVQNWRARPPLSAVPWLEASVMGLVFLGIAALALGGYLPFAYIVMPPLLWVAARFDFKGAAIVLILLALITAAFTISGVSQFAGDPESQRQKQIMLHLFLAISALSALIVAAISRQHQQAVLTLRQSVEALRDRERELSQLIDMVPAQIRRLTPQGEPTFFNKRLIDFFGLDVADLDKHGNSRLVTAMRTLVHPDESTHLLETVRRSFATGIGGSMKYRMRRADGAYRWVDGRWEPLRDDSGAITQWYAISIDIDDEMRAQEALRQSERRLQQMIDAVPAMIWSTTREGTPTFVNKRFTDIIGATVEDITAPDGSPALRAIIHPDDMSATAATISRSFGTGVPYVMQYRQIRRDGSYRWTETRAEALRDESGAIIQWYGVSVDVDDLVRAKEALRESERLLWQLVETLPAMIYCATPDGEPTYRSRQLRDFLGFDVEDNDEAGKTRLNGTLDAVIHPHDLSTVKERYAHSLSTGTPYALKHRLRRVSGEYRWVETRAAAMRNADGAIMQWNGICLDIDDQVRAQEELRLVQESLARASQAASLAELSASIAHEVNQPLAAIVANSHACERWLSAQPPNVERAKITAERIIRDANAAADVVSRIRALFRQSVERRSSAALPDVIAEARSLMAEEAVRRRVRMDVEVESGLPPVAFDRVQVQQVLINLIRNGMDAMDSTPIDRILAMRVRRMGDAVQTEISDRGRGITLPDKIFQPFFTTKEHGMGMGLAICRSIVESHGGQLWAENNEPHGARFIFTLPVEVKAAS